MFANFLRLNSRRAPADCSDVFVQEVAVTRDPVRNRRIERLFLICWILIAIKCVVVAWAVRRYHVPFSALWVILPTVLFAAWVTAVYWRRR